ncbi:MAG: hypothetical protein M3436_07790 [Pseudomonadota bacterium]|nr:hypothetical protein [Pseudomonadota bacterium]
MNKSRTAIAASRARSAASKAKNISVAGGSRRAFWRRVAACRLYTICERKKPAAEAIARLARDQSHSVPTQHELPV